MIVWQIFSSPDAALHRSPAAFELNTHGAQSWHPRWNVLWWSRYFDWGRLRLTSLETKDKQSYKTYRTSCTHVKRRVLLQVARSAIMMLPSTRMRSHSVFRGKRGKSRIDLMATFPGRATLVDELMTSHLPWICKIDNNKWLQRAFQKAGLVRLLRKICV